MAGDVVKPGEQTSTPTKPQLWLAGLVLAGYVAFLVVLILNRSDEHWDRLVYLFSGFEAVVFAAAGMVFGTTVHRTQLDAARQDAATFREEAARNAQDAQHLNTLSAMIEAKAGAGGAAAPDGIFGARPGGTGGSDNQDLAELARVVQAIREARG